MQIESTQNFKLISQILFEKLRFKVLAKLSIRQNGVFWHFHAIIKATKIFSTMFKTTFIANLEHIHKIKTKNDFPITLHSFKNKVVKWDFWRKNLNISVDNSLHPMFRPTWIHKYKHHALYLLWISCSIHRDYAYLISKV